MLSRNKKIRLTTYNAGLLQSKAYRALNVFMSKALAKHDLSIPQWAALGILYDEKECRPSTLAATLGIKPPVATRLLNALESKGLVVRTAHADDNRGAVVRITPHGTKLVTIVERQLRSEMRLFLSDIKLNELASYIKVLSKLASKLQGQPNNRAG